MGLGRIVSLLLLLASAVTALYPFGSEIDQLLPRGDDVSSEFALSVPIKFYGQSYPHIYVNTNGILSFLTEIPKFFNEPFPLEYPVIAPLYSNVDTRGSGNVFYRESREPDILSTVAKKVAALYPSLPAFLPLAAVVVTWENVGYHDGKSDKVNTYQVVISSDGTESFVELLYPENGVTWIRAESPKSSLPDAIAQAGLSAPGGRLSVLKGSGTDRVVNLPRWSNTLSQGEYMFRVGNIEDTGLPEPPQRSLNLDDEEPYEPQSCRDGSLLCHQYSECRDEPEGGFCCRCQQGYFGDGRNCLNYDSHRMLGKLNISINGVEGKDLNMQGYIVTSDGRTYTAISGIPRVIGYDMQLLISLGSFVGFLFAKPTGDTPNGYQLTGGIVNHTVDLTFDTLHHISIKQRYSGLDLFEQVKMDAEVVGTLPSVPPGTKLNVLDFQEHFTRIGPGLFRSQSKHTFEIDDSNERHEVTVDQTIQFHEYCPAYRDLASLRLKVSRHYLSFEEKNSILRLASTNKMSRSTGQDPCVEGHATCVANSSCLVEDDSFRCVCNPGFQSVNDQSSDFGCVDINECEDGTANCHPRALCVNEVGTYSCQCLPGFTGNGRHCEDLDIQVPIPNGVCRGYGAQQTCDCNQGYEKARNSTEYGDNPEYGIICVDINECEDAIQTCDPRSVCYNTPGSYECLPPEDCGDGDCPENFVCSYNDTVGSDVCTCRPDYVLDGPSCIPPSSENSFVRTCVEGECWCPPGYFDNGVLCVSTTTQTPQTSSTCQNCDTNAQCIYVPDKRAYECTCKPGFEGDGYTCTELEISCAQSSICGPNAECHYNSLSKRHVCICNDGYQGDGITCYPSENECQQPCHPDAFCDFRTCVCIEGFIGNGIDSCERSNCEAQCHPFADCLYEEELGYRCKCRQGYEGDGYYCTEIITCHENPSMCSPSATCIYSSDSYQCKCNEGFFGNGTHCKEISRQEEGFLLLNKGRSTIRLPFNPVGNNIGHPIQINGDQHAIGIAIDCIEGRVYWSDIMNQKIKSSTYNGSDVQDFIVSGVKSPEGLAIDWINRILYWTDSGLHVIASARLDDKQINHIIKTGLVNPRGIAVHPHRRKLFWSDWNRKEPIIESSDLDGNNREILVQKPSVMLPNSLAIDWDSNEVCWADAGLKRIECYDFLRRVPRIVVQNCDYPFGLAITSDAYYWTDWSTGQVESSSKGSGTLTKSIRLPIGGDDKLYGLVAVTSCPL